jgi:hypothetical protein
MSSTFTLDHTNAQVPIHGTLVRKMSSVYRVNAAGDLLGLSVHIEGEPELPAIFKILSSRFILDLEGEVVSGRLAPRLSVKVEGNDPFERTLPEVSISRGGAVLLPLHPVNRIRGLSLGQTWRVSVVDPVQDSLEALFGTHAGPRLLQAHVRPELENFSWGRRLDVPCLVIDYTGDDFTACTWVAQDRGLVLCQEANIDGHRWVMYRD